MKPGAERLDLFHRGEELVLTTLGSLSDDDLLDSSGLDGWSRRHLVSHLARNADALGNLLAWARTGVEAPMYRSAADRAAGIDAGADRPPAEVRADAVAASERLVAAVADLPDAAWDAEVRTARDRPIDAGEVPWMRIRETWVHTVDLQAGIDFDAVPGAVVDTLLDEVTAGLAGRDDCPPLLLVESDGHTWRIGPREAIDVDVTRVIGPPHELLAWLIGRTDGSALSASTPDGHPPIPPPWL